MTMTNTESDFRPQQPVPAVPTVRIQDREKQRRRSQNKIRKQLLAEMAQIQARLDQLEERWAKGLNARTVKEPEKRQKWCLAS